ncbi:MAG: thioredoxin-disulfide reductase [Clostridia bacterium]|nr:thioredoxin-disulfide reductase [Clostridia bacterium]
MGNEILDVIIIGGGPAGYTAALYAVRAGLKTVVLEKFSAGGQMTQTEQIDNYPGFNEGIDGFTLGYKMQQGAEHFGAKTIQTEVQSVDLLSNPKKITTGVGEFYSKTVIIATGADHKHLGIENEEKLIGRGVGYCAACDGMFYRGKTVAVVGGGNSAAADALLLSKICEKVYLIHRRDALKAEKIYRDPLEKANNIEFKWNAQIEKLIFDKTIEGVVIKNNDGSTEEISLGGLFISVGRNPETKLFVNQIELDDLGYIVADETTKTSIPGVYAVGDVRTKVVRQIVTAVGDGATAAHFAEEYISNYQG